MHPWSRVEQSLGRRAGLDRPSAEEADTPPQPERDERDSVPSLWTVAVVRLVPCARGGGGL